MTEPSIIHYTPGDDIDRSTTITAACGETNIHHPEKELFFHTGRADWVTCPACLHASVTEVLHARQAARRAADPNGVTRASKDTL